MNIRLEKMEKKEPEHDNEHDNEFFVDLIDSLLTRISNLEDANRHLIAALAAYADADGEEDEDYEDPCLTCDVKEGCPFADDDDCEPEDEDEKAFDRELLKAQLADAMENGANKVRHVVDKASAAAVEFAHSEQGQKMKSAAVSAFNNGKKLGKNLVKDLRHMVDEAAKADEKPEEHDTDKK